MIDEACKLKHVKISRKHLEMFTINHETPIACDRKSRRLSRVIRFIRSTVKSNQGTLNYTKKKRMYLLVTYVFVKD